MKDVSLSVLKSYNITFQYNGLATLPADFVVSG
jgi:hypothetical protein